MMLLIKDQDPPLLTESIPYITKPKIIVEHKIVIKRSKEILKQVRWELCFKV
jgi:hypothetical protein